MLESAPLLPLPTQSLPSTSHIQAILVMLIVSLCSGTGTVYTELVMNHSSFKKEPIHLQNARLYTAGVLLNSTYYLYDTARRSGIIAAAYFTFFTNMRPIHWAVVPCLSLIGLVISAIIKFHGNMTKVYAAALSMFVAAWTSQRLLGEPAPLTFYIGAAIAAAAVHLYSRPPGILPRTSHGGKPSLCAFNYRICCSANRQFDVCWFRRW